MQASIEVYTGSLLMRATFEPPRPISLSEQALRSHLGLDDFNDLRTISEIVLALHDVVRLAREIPELVFTVPPHISEEGQMFLETQGVTESRRAEQYAERSYRLVSLDMHSPFTVVLEFPPVAVTAFGFTLLALAERLATSETRVSKRRAKDLRDKAQYDRERAIIENARLDMAVRLFSDQPKPTVIEIIGGDESFDDAEPIEGSIRPEDNPPDAGTPSG